MIDWLASIHLGLILVVIVLLSGLRRWCRSAWITALSCIIVWWYSLPLR